MLGRRKRVVIGGGGKSLNFKEGKKGKRGQRVLKGGGKEVMLYQDSRGGEVRSALLLRGKKRSILQRMSMSVKGEGGGIYNSYKKRRKVNTPLQKEDRLGYWKVMQDARRGRV